MTAILRNPKYEIYAQARAKGKTKLEAAQEAGYKSSGSMEKRPEVQRRIRELLGLAAVRTELSRKDILDRIYDDWELARKLGQVPAALKAAELMGREMHKMFTERKEIGGPGDFDNKSEEELRNIIFAEMRDLGWEDNKLLIEHEDKDKTIN